MSWQIEGFIWLEWVVEKIITKHNVSPEEVEEAFRNPPYKPIQADEGKYISIHRLCLGRTSGQDHHCARYDRYRAPLLRSQTR